MTYPNEAGFVAGSDTSEAAADSIGNIAEAMRKTILKAIVGKPQTCDEVELACNYSHQSCSARIRELALDGRIVDTGQRRKTRSGRNARVYAKFDTPSNVAV